MPGVHASGGSKRGAHPPPTSLVTKFFSISCNFWGTFNKFVSRRPHLRVVAHVWENPGSATACPLEVAYYFSYHQVSRSAGIRFRTKTRILQVNIRFVRWHSFYVVIVSHVMIYFLNQIGHPEHFGFSKMPDEGLVLLRQRFNKLVVSTFHWLLSIIWSDIVYHATEFVS